MHWTPEPPVVQPTVDWLKLSRGMANKARLSGTTKFPLGGLPLSYVSVTYTWNCLSSATYIQLMANAVISCFVHTYDTTQALFFKKYGTSSDVWSYGMLMNEIWSLGEKLFPSLSPLEVSCDCIDHQL